MLSVAGMYAIAYLARRVARLPRVQTILDFRLRESLILVGERDEVARTLREWVHVDTIEVVGVCLPEHDAGPSVVEGHPVLGSARDIVSVCQRFPVDAVALHDCRPRRADGSSRVCSGPSSRARPSSASSPQWRTPTWSESTRAPRDAG